jgi:hypothetical protein
MVSELDRVVDKENGKRGVTFSVSVRMLTDTHAEARGDWYATPYAAGFTIFILDLEGNTWRITGVKTEWISCLRIPARQAEAITA